METALITDTTGEQSCLSFWNLTTGVILKSYRNGACARNSFGFVGNEYIISGQYEQQLLHIYDANNEQIIKKIVCPGKVSSLAVSPDGQYCVVALVEKIYIWQINTGNLIKVLSKHYQNINVIRFTRDGSFFLSCGDDNLLLIWNFSNICQPKDDFSDDISEKPTFILSHHSLPIKDFYVGAGGMRCHVATCSLDQTCKIYDLSSGMLVCSFLFENSCSSVTMDADEKRLFSGTTNGKIHFVNLYSKDKVREIHIPTNESTLQAHEKEVVSLSVSMDSTKLLSGSLDSTAKLWHISSKQCLRTFSFKGEITNAIILPLPCFLQENQKSLRSRIPFPNFNRNVYVPFSNKADFDSPEWQDKIPVIIKPLDLSFHEQFFLPTDEINCDFQVNDIMQKCSTVHSSQELSLKSATRDELIERINNLEAITKEFYTLTCEKIFKGT